MYLILAVLGATLATPSSDPKVVAAQRISASLGAPAIDGRLDDAIWTVADSVSGFTQMEPNPGQPSRYRTVARVAFDDNAVYVMVRAYDEEPGKIVGQLTRRDQESSSDWLMVGFDSHHDRRTAYVFGVNPVGVKRDMIISNDSEMDSKWDAVWDVRTRVDELGWTAEFQIPLSALRFSTKGDGVWGFQVVREVQRDREMSAWTPMRPDEPRVVSRFGELHGMSGLPSPRRLEMLPYTVSQLTRAPGERSNPFYAGNDLGATAGVDVKYGVTSNLTLDMTLNPDFGQVEADPSQVNLSAFETFFPERRPFFTEGADIFRFGISLGDGDGANEQLFYSRRIGRAPNGYPSVGSGEYADVPKQTRILGAAKLSGRTQNGWSIGMLNAVTSEESARISTPSGALRREVVEPFSNYSVLRLRRNANEGRTQIGIVGTGVVRRLDDTGLDWLRSSALAGGVDFSHRFGQDQWSVSGSLLGSQIHGSERAILRAQRSTARYFQRPDADHLEVDSTATSLSGWFANYSIGKIGGGKWRGGVLGQVRSPGFEVNDMGYQRNADQIFNVLWLGYREVEPGKVFLSYNLNTNGWVAQSFGGERIGLGGNVNGWGQFRNYMSVYGGVNRDQGNLSTTALRGGPALLEPGSYNGWFGLNGDNRKPLTLGLNGGWRLEDETDGHSLRLGVSANWRASGSTQLSLSPSYSINRSAAQYVAQVVDQQGGRHYVFGELDQRTVSLSARLNQTFTPNLSFQLYAQPFISAGEYRGFKEVGDPRAERFASRFREFSSEAVSREGGQRVVRLGPDAGSTIRFGNPDFNVRALNTNAVLRWEYRPGSTVFLVWSHGRNSFAGEGEFRPSRDFDALLDAPATNVFLIKANWWVSM